MFPIMLINRNIFQMFLSSQNESLMPHYETGPFRLGFLGSSFRISSLGIFLSLGLTLETVQMSNQGSGAG